MSLISENPIEFFMLVTASEMAKKFTARAGYADLQYQFEELIDELALDHVAEVHARCAECEYRVDKFEEALHFIDTVKHLQVPTHLTVGRVNKILGYIRIKQGDVETGKACLEDALSIFERNNSPVHLEEMQRELRQFANEGEQITGICHHVESLCDMALDRLQ